MDLRSAEALFARLTLREQDAAIRGARIYAADLKRRGRSQALEAHRWLGERRFEDAIAVSRDKVGAPQVFVAYGTPAYEAWDRKWRREHNGIRAPNHPYSGHDPRWRGKTGWSFPTLFPPDQETEPPVADAAG